MAHSSPRTPKGRTGIWHETYLVRAGECEAIYSDLPEAGLAAAGRAVPLTRSSSARLRLHGGDPAAAPAGDGQPTGVSVAGVVGRG